MCFKEQKKVIDYAKRHGFILARHNKHIIMKRGIDTISISSTPSDRYGYANVIRDINRICKRKGVRK